MCPNIDNRSSTILFASFSVIAQHSELYNKVRNSCIKVMRCVKLQCLEKLHLACVFVDDAMLPNTVCQLMSRSATQIFVSENNR